MSNRHPPAHKPPTLIIAPETGGKSPRDWDARYRQQAAGIPSPAEVLAQLGHLLPPRGRALDLACGLGGNALALARRGLDTHAWDYSEEAIERLRRLASACGVAIHCEVRDVVSCPPGPASFDVIVVSRFLERSLAPALQAALRPAGLLYYQTFVRDRVGGRGPTNPAFRLDDNELLHLFPGMRVLYYHEEGSLGDTTLGFRDQAMLVAQQLA